MADTWSKINDRITALGELNTRQDATANFLHWDDNPYELVDPDGKTKLDDAISVTPNLPKVFAHGVVADLLSGKWQTVVEGNISATKQHQVESFIDDAFAQADEFLLTEHGIPSLFGWLCNHVCVRYAIGAKLISQIVDKEYKIDLLPVDMRWTPFVRNKWVAPIFFRIGADMEEELEKYEKQAKDGGGEYTKVSLGKDVEVRDYWDKEKNELWVDNKLVFTQKNMFGNLPFVIVVPASGFMLRDKGYSKYEGEDILFLNAGLYKELARSLSLEQTLGYAALCPAYEKEKQVVIDGAPSQLVPKLGVSLDVAAGERHLPVPRGDINRAGQTARVDLMEMIANGGPMSPRQYNTPPSAILLAGETEMISRLQNAKKDALGIFRSQLARMMVKQFIAASGKKGEVAIGGEGRKTKHSASTLGDLDTYTISYHLSVKSKRQELANLAEFAAVYDKLPLEWTLPNILMADDPAGIINALEIEQAEADPAIKLLKMARSYARKSQDAEDDTEAEALETMSKILTERGVTLIKSRGPQAAPQVEQPKPNNQLLTSLAGKAMAGDVIQTKGVSNEQVD